MSSEVFLAALRLGLTSFGGPVAHLEYFRREYVERRKWLDQAHFSDLVTMSQVLPGPASSQLGMAVGMHRAGVRGAIASWAGFTLPSAVLMGAFGLLSLGDVTWMRGLGLAAIAVVAAAVVSLIRTTLRGVLAMGIAALSAVTATVLPVAGVQIAVILLGALIGWRWINVAAPTANASSPVRSRRSAILIGALVSLFALLSLWPTPLGQFLAAIYCSGALVFGGGHVVLPLLESGVVRSGMIDGDLFLAGYGAAQALPGPLFSFAAYLGAISYGWWGAIAATIAIFAPGALLVIAVAPYWDRIRSIATLRGAITGATAAVVGLLASVLFLPITRSAIATPLDALLVALAFIALLTRKAPVLVVVAACALAGVATTA